MLFRSLVAASALSVSASAFLVVPEAHPPSHNGNLPHALELEDARTETVQLTCDEWPFPETGADGVVSWSEDTKSSFVSSTHQSRDGL